MGSSGRCWRRFPRGLLASRPLVGLVHSAAATAAAGARLCVSGCVPRSGFAGLFQSVVLTPSLWGLAVRLLPARRVLAMGSLGWEAGGSSPPSA